VCLAAGLFPVQGSNPTKGCRATHKQICQIAVLVRAPTTERKWIVIPSGPILLQASNTWRRFIPTDYNFDFKTQNWVAKLFTVGYRILPYTGDTFYAKSNALS
jgi:hypothetical protein